MESEPSRKEIWKMFDAISPTYDRVNQLMTLGLDRKWRKGVAKYVPKKTSLSLLDCATGTADQILALLKAAPQIHKAVGIDLSKEMLRIGREKVSLSPYQDKITLLEASALSLPFEEPQFDLVTMSFGIRNVTNPALCLREMKRVLKPGGRLLILETSLPKNLLLQKLHLLYIHKILPSIGGRISKRKSAYEYLNKTAATFPSGKAFCDLLEREQFKEVKAYPKCFGAVSIYVGTK